MLETLLIIILLPIAIVVVLGMTIAAFVLWKLIVAILLWATAAVMFFANHADTSGSLFWWAFVTFMVGCGFFVSWQEAFAEPSKQHYNKKHEAKEAKTDWKKDF
jgi:hypothetical protein